MKKDLFYILLANGLFVSFGLPSSAQLADNQPGPTAVARARSSLTGPAPIALDLLPSGVQKTLRQYALGAPIEDIESGTINGQTVYRATFHRNGQLIALDIAQNGGLMPDAENDRYLASVGMLPDRSGTPAAPIPAPTPDWRTAPARIALSNPSAVSLESVPQPVRDTLLSYAGGTKLGTIQQGQLAGRTVYEAELLPQDRKITLRVDKNGALLNDQVNDRFLSEYAARARGPVAVGRAPASQVVSAVPGSAGLAPLNNAISLPLDQVPAAVRATIAAQASSAPIDFVSRGTLKDRPVYDASFTRGGQRVQVRVGEDGSILGSQTIVP